MRLEQEKYEFSRLLQNITKIKIQRKECITAKEGTKWIFKLSDFHDENPLNNMQHLFLKKKKTLSLCLLKEDKSKQFDLRNQKRS